MGTYLQLTVTDTLGVRIDGLDAFDPRARVSRTCWYRLPGDWLVDGALRSWRRDQLIDGCYAPGWRRGNPDGSRYVVLDIQERVLSDAEAIARPWLCDRAAYYVCPPAGAVRAVAPSEL